MKLGQANGGNDYVDQLDSNERQQDTPGAVDQKISGQDLGRPQGPESDPLQSQRNQSNDDQRVENHRTQNCALRRFQKHDVQWSYLRKGANQHGWQDGKIFGYIIRDTKGRECAPGDQQLLSNLHDLQQLGWI